MYMLACLVKLIAKYAVGIYVLSIWKNRLQSFVLEGRLKVCGENTGFGGKCITNSDIANLWRLYLEV